MELIILIMCWLVIAFFVLLLTALYPPVQQIVDQCGKFILLDRLLTKLFARKHKVCEAVWCFELFCLPTLLKLLTSVR